MFGFLLVLPFAMGATGFWLAERLADEGILDPNAAKAWECDLSMQKQELQQIRRQTDQELEALTLRLADLQAKLLRLDDMSIKKKGVRIRINVYPLSKKIPTRKNKNS